MFYENSACAGRLYIVCACVLDKAAPVAWIDTWTERGEDLGIIACKRHSYGLDKLREGEAVSVCEFSKQ
jgi:hypothetical protein